MKLRALAARMETIDTSKTLENRLSSAEGRVSHLEKRIDSLLLSKETINTMIDEKVTAAKDKWDSELTNLKISLSKDTHLSLDSLQKEINQLKTDVKKEISAAIKLPAIEPL